MKTSSYKDFSDKKRNQSERKCFERESEDSCMKCSSFLALIYGYMLVCVKDLSTRSCVCVCVRRKNIYLRVKHSLKFFYQQGI